MQRAGRDDQHLAAGLKEVSSVFEGAFDHEVCRLHDTTLPEQDRP